MGVEERSGPRDVRKGTVAGNANHTSRRCEHSARNLLRVRQERRRARLVVGLKRGRRQLHASCDYVAEPGELNFTSANQLLKAI